MSNDFYVKRILKNYLTGDTESKEYATLLEWSNIFYEPNKIPASVNDSIIRLGLVQWQMRNFNGINAFMEQVEYFVDVVSDYQSDFILFPEFFNTPLMEPYNHLPEPEAMRQLATHTLDIRDRISALAISYNVNIISGSMPFVEEGELFNMSYLCHRNGKVDHYRKIHITPNERRHYGMVGGNEIPVFETDCGKVGIVICYDVEFPELPRLMADKGMQILFVPFLTDTQNAYTRVRNCAQARAIENECYVAIAGCVGNLPKVNNMDIQYAQSVVFTPSDFGFPSNGVKAEATPNTEMMILADVDLKLLKQLNANGSVQILKDRRKDLYQVTQLSSKAKITKKATPENETVLI
ncbi:MAG: carbon-nitrogen hydrolase family protein [Spirosomataceae bacterium]